jgi:uncharacterized protein (DUF305 family)
MKTFKYAAFLMLILSVVLAACSPEAATLPQTSQTDPDELFINMMVPHHEGAVEMARIALERSQRPEIQAMAQAIISGQDAEIEMMRDWKEAWFGSRDTPPMSEMPSMQEMPGHGSAGHAMDMQADVDALRSAPEPFDLAFIDAMIPHHESAIASARQLLSSTQRPELQEMGQAIIAAQEGEIAQMTAWRNAWYPDAPPLPTSPH